jgi:hypothetical protein
VRFDYFYELMPVDDFSAYTPFELWKDRLGTEYPLGFFGDIIAAAVILSEVSAWDGTIREGPFVFPVFHDTFPSVAVIWKQEHGGTTYILSPIPLTATWGREVYRKEENP